MRWSLRTTTIYGRCIFDFVCFGRIRSLRQSNRNTGTARAADTADAVSMNLQPVWASHN